MKALKKTGIWMAFATIVAGQVLAQPAPAGPAPTAGTAGTDAEAKPTLPPISAADAKQQAQDLRNQVRAHIQHVHHLQTKARNAKDVIKLTCVNDKFIKLKAEANIFDLAHRELIALLDADGERATLFNGVTKASANVRKVREEADGCIGEQVLGKASETDHTAPDLLDDPTQYLPWDIEVEPPAYASPYI